MTLGWGIVSTGRHPENKIVPAMKRAAGNRVIGVYSRDAGRAEAFARRHEIPFPYSSLAELLKNREVQAVFIASPNSLHAQHTKMAAEAGKHVLVEKPMAVNVSEAWDMVQVCRKNRVKLGVGFHLRHHPGHRRARRLIQEGILGTITLVQAQFFFPDKRGVVDLPPRPPLSQWWEDPAMTGGAYSIMGMGVHALDLLQYLLGQPITEVAAITDGQTAQKPLEEIAVIALRLANGPVGTVCCGRRVPDTRNDAVIYGTRGRVWLKDTLYEPLRGKLEVVSDSANLEEPYEGDLLSSYQLQIDAFRRAIQEGAEFDASGMDGLRAVQVASAIIESASTGRTVKIEPFESKAGNE
jgi:1,5-anhydro-D-fructose reductase (1,5-anhydro-D-mannitol-forming)